jgi:phosphatidylglycerol---prolipoprotein diacylglyceryl transferase
MHPILFTIPDFHLFAWHIGPLPIFSYGAMLALAFVAAIALSAREAARAGINIEHVLDCAFHIIVCSIIMARIGYVISHLEEYRAGSAGAMFWNMLKIHEGGLSFHGGVAGGAIAVIYFCTMRKIPVFQFGDAVMPGLALGLAIGRIGCFLNGCCYGRPWNGPWAMTVPSLHDGIHRHPTQIYDLIFNVTIALLLVGPLKRLKRKNGDLFAFWLILSGITRFILEIFRYGETTVSLTASFTVAQWVGAAMAAGGLFLYFLKPKTNDTPAAS